MLIFLLLLLTVTKREISSTSMMHMRLVIGLRMTWCVFCVFTCFVFFVCMSSFWLSLCVFCIFVFFSLSFLLFKFFQPCVLCVFVFFPPQIWSSLILPRQVCVLCVFQLYWIFLGLHFLIFCRLNFFNHVFYVFLCFPHKFGLLWFFSKTGMCFMCFCVFLIVLSFFKTEFFSSGWL